MSNVPVFVGLDYHQDSIQVCVLNQQGDVLMNRSASNDCRELERLARSRRRSPADLELRRVLGGRPVPGAPAGPEGPAGPVAPGRPAGP